MPTHLKIVIGGVVVGLITLAFLPTWVSLVIIALGIGVPVVAYAALDPSQRRRLRDQRRRQLGR